MLCADCRNGYHAPYDRFERLASQPALPSYLQRCRECRALWHETSGEARRLTLTDARLMYPRVGS